MIMKEFFGAHFSVFPVRAPTGRTAPGSVILAIGKLILLSVCHLNEKGDAFSNRSLNLVSCHFDI
jgi:hypothetical protein